MRVPDQIKAVLSPVVNGRVYADEAPQKAKLPFIVFEWDSEEPITTIHPLPSATIIQSYRINVWDASRERVNALSESVRAALDEAIFAKEMEGVYMGDAWGYDETMNLNACQLIYQLIERRREA